MLIAASSKIKYAQSILTRKCFKVSKNNTLGSNYKQYLNYSMGKCIEASNVPYDAQK